MKNKATIELEKCIKESTVKDGQHLFTSGPHTFTLFQGELLFIVGGNGSGKSTFLNLITCDREWLHLTFRCEGKGTSVIEISKRIIIQYTMIKPF